MLKGLEIIGIVVGGMLAIYGLSSLLVAAKGKISSWTWTSRFILVLGETVALLAGSVWIVGYVFSRMKTATTASAFAPRVPEYPSAIVWVVSFLLATICVLSVGLIVSTTSFCLRLLDGKRHTPAPKLKSQILL